MDYGHLEKQNWEESERRREEDQKGERMRRKKRQVREKVGKSRFTVFSTELWLWRVEK